MINKRIVGQGTIGKNHNPIIRYRLHILPNRWWRINCIGIYTKYLFPNIKIIMFKIKELKQ